MLGTTHSIGLGDGVSVAFSSTSGFRDGAKWTVAGTQSTGDVGAATAVTVDSTVFKLDGGGTVTMASGDILLTSTSSQAITHTVSAATNHECA